MIPATKEEDHRHLQRGRQLDEIQARDLRTSHSAVAVMIVSSIGASGSGQGVLCRQLHRRLDISLLQIDTPIDAAPVQPKPGRICYALWYRPIHV